jgi:hypothetical protein
LQQDVAERAKVLLAEGERIINEATTRGLRLRLLGSVSFQLHCQKFRYIARKYMEIKDIDIAGYGKETNKVVAMMREFGYADEPMVTALFGDRRTIWDNKTTGIHVDIFLDKLEMNHTIPFENRLNFDPFTISLADMWLEKMQIVQINEKDIVETIMLMREHDIGDQTPETIDAKYIAKLLGNEWGFYYTCTTNLNLVRDRLREYRDLTDEDRTVVNDRIERLRKIIDDQPKAMSWKLRARVGPKTKWYRDVEEVKR